MPNKIFLIATAATGLALAACSTTPGALTTPITTSAVPAATAPQKPGTPVVATRASRMHVWAGFMEKDCSAAPPTITISQQPAKGAVSLKPNELTYIQHSTSGKCVGQSLPGTGIYYTAKKGQIGADRFTVTATSKSGQVATRTFKVNIVE